MSWWPKEPKDTLKITLCQQYSKIASIQWPRKKVWNLLRSLSRLIIFQIRINMKWLRCWCQISMWCFSFTRNFSHINHLLRQSSSHSLSSEGISSHLVSVRTQQLAASILKRKLEITSIKIRYLTNRTQSLVKNRQKPLGSYNQLALPSKIPQRYT